MPNSAKTQALPTLKVNRRFTLSTVADNSRPFASAIVQEALEGSRGAPRVPSAASSLLRAREVALWLDISEWRVYDLVRQNLIPHVKMGRSIRFQRKAVQEWIETGGTGLGEA